jgi:hypothetical protein
MSEARALKMREYFTNVISHESETFDFKEPRISDIKYNSTTSLRKKTTSPIRFNDTFRS